MTRRHRWTGRNDCAAKRVIDNALVVVLPIQNPGGREADRRENSYGFDPNRDWFARTQPAADGKVAMLQKFPPAMFIDAHEMGQGYFFPPNADPIYHEISDRSLGWMQASGSAMAVEFGASASTSASGRSTTSSTRGTAKRRRGLAFWAPA